MPTYHQLGINRSFSGHLPESHEMAWDSKQKKTSLVENHTGTVVERRTEQGYETKNTDTTPGV